MSCPIHCEERRVRFDGGDSISAVIGYPDGPESRDTPVVILAHGAGNDMRSPFLSAIHEGLAGRGYVTVKFNFPYKERGRRLPDRAPVLEACYTQVLQRIRADRGRARIVIGGKSLGGRIASHLAAGGAGVAGLILLGYPLHPAGQTDQLRVAHLGGIRAPMLFFSGTRDALCDLGLLRQALAQVSAPWQLHVVTGADHSFHVPRALQRADGSVWAEIVDVAARWLQQLTP
jgi:predicted alpha/beta-hydrolase family hydrolase